MTESIYITISEAKKMLNCSRNTVIKLCEEGRLERFDISKGMKKPTWRILRESIENLHL